MTGTKKTRQHFVFRAYLDAWVHGKSLWCLRHRKNLFQASPNNVAHSRDFYRVREHTNAELASIRGMINASNIPGLRDLNMDTLTRFQIIGVLPRLAQEASQDDVIKREIDSYVNNAEENLHAHDEARATGMLKALRAGNLGFLADLEAYTFFTRFVIMQQMRSPSLLARMRDPAAAAQLGYDLEEMRARLGHYPADIVGGALRQMAVNNVGFYLFSKRASTSICLLEAQCSGFLTGDQPVCNTRHRGDVSLADEIEFFYPLAPQCAILITPESPTPGLSRREVGPEEVARYNAMIARVSHEFLFASCRSELEPYVTLIDRQDPTTDRSAEA